MVLNRKFILFCFIISIALFISGCSDINTQLKYKNQDLNNLNDTDEANLENEVTKVGKIKIEDAKEEAIPNKIPQKIANEKLFIPIV